jgi:hypothetical protein
MFSVVRFVVLFSVFALIDLMAMTGTFLEHYSFERNRNLLTDLDALVTFCKVRHKNDRGASQNPASHCRVGGNRPAGTFAAGNV